jgi:iron-sulfur cluster repair protein YtfE (RIC family)
MSLSIDLTPPAALPIQAPEQMSVIDQSAVSPVNSSQHRPNNTVPLALFTLTSNRNDLVSAYPDLESYCIQLGFTEGITLSQWCSAPEWALLILARAARPPQPAPAMDRTPTGITPLITHLLNHHHRQLRNELRRMGILIRDFSHRYHGTVTAGIDHDFMRLEENIAKRLDFEEFTVFPQCLAIDVEQCSPLVEKNTTHDVVVHLQALVMNNDQSASELEHLLRQIWTQKHLTSDPDLTIVSDGLVAIELALVLHAAKERNLLAPAVIFKVERRRAQHDPAYCIGSPPLKRKFPSDS